MEKVIYPNFTTIVVDNGSTDGSVAEIRSLCPRVPIFETGQNLGFAGGNNVGISWALHKGYDWILLLNNDTVVDPHFLQGFMEAAKENPQAKILGAKIYRYNDRARIDHFGGMWNEKTAEFESIGMNVVDDGASFEKMIPVDYVCGAALLMHAEVPQAIGFLEEKFFLFWEETDFCFRAKRAGFEIWAAPGAKVWHKVSASFTGGKPQMHYFWWRSRLLWIERNCSEDEKRKLYKTIIGPELKKTARHYVLKSLQNVMRSLFFRQKDEKTRAKALRCKAGLVGALHYYRRKFGNCPEWLKR